MEVQAPRTTVTRQTRTAYSKYEYAIATDATRIQYKRHFKQFLRFAGINDTDLETGVNILYQRIKEDKDWFSDCLMAYISEEKGRVGRREISGSTLRNLHKPIKLFCDMNDILLNWRLITRGMPAGKKSANDRTPTISEIHQLLEYSDVRIKPIVLVMVSSGIRLGAWTYLKWKHVIPIMGNDNTIVAAKVIVYAGEPEQYFTFMTPEAYFALKEWMDFRASYGENITDESWLMRNKWKTVGAPTYSHKPLLAKHPRKLSHHAIRVLINRGLHKQNIRTLLEDGVRSHEFKAVHGFRKYFKTVCESGGMKPANVELLIGHEIGISSSYYKPTEHQLLEDYLSVVNMLTVDKAFKLQEQLILKEKENNLYKKDLEEMRKEMNDMRSWVNSKLHN